MSANLRIVEGSRVLGVLLAHDLVDVLHADFDGFGGGALEVGVERGIDAETLMREVLVADALDELVVNEVDEVGGFAGVDAGR